MSGSFCIISWMIRYLRDSQVRASSGQQTKLSLFWPNAEKSNRTNIFFLLLNFVGDFRAFLASLWTQNRYLHCDNIFHWKIRIWLAADGNGLLHTAMEESPTNINFIEINHIRHFANPTEQNVTETINSPFDIEFNSNKRSPSVTSSDNWPVDAL